jgi:antitoxin PrlF
LSKLEATAVYSKVSVKSQTVLPREVRERLGVGPGDRLRYLFDARGVRLEKAFLPGGDPFVTFSEWSSDAGRRSILPQRGGRKEIGKGLWLAVLKQLDIKD